MKKAWVKCIATHLGVLTLSILFTGCVIKDIGNTVEQTVKGDYFLQSDQSKRGRESFRLEVEENPDSALAHYYYGRFLLQEQEDRLALTHLIKARDRAPEKADYQFWTGVAYGAIGNISREEKSYQAALAIDDNHLQSLIYLGHNQFTQKKYRSALQLYQKALDIWPSSPSALYNRALILHILERTPEERIAWLDYLYRYPSCPKGVRAADYLNMTGDFSFRNQNLGDVAITIEKIRFIPFTARLAEASFDSLRLVGDVFQDLNKGTLQIVVYQKNNSELAKKRAIDVKQFLLREFSKLETSQIGVSWFAEPQKITVQGKNLSLDEAVSFFVTR